MSSNATYRLILCKTLPAYNYPMTTHPSDMALNVLMEAKRSVRISEIFGPTLQGEGPDIGRPAVFLRFHGCPVQCPGCDTAYTWDGSERGTSSSYLNIYESVRDILRRYPQCGVVFTGGEPLIHYHQEEFANLIDAIQAIAKWVSIETSGATGQNPYKDTLSGILRRFDRVVWSPKTYTEGLPAKQHPTHLHVQRLNEKAFLHTYQDFKYGLDKSKLTIKFVVKSGSDVEAVKRLDDGLGLTEGGFDIQLMPFGYDAEDLAPMIDQLTVEVAKYGYRITPRLHALIWGRERGR